jgi:type I restriction enzyme, R subunit
MSDVGQREILTQQRLVQFFQDELNFRYLGHWQDREGNSNVEERLLVDWLKSQDHNSKVITKVLHELGKAKALGGGRTLYDANREVYSKLRYGVNVKPDVGEHNISVFLIDWETPENNDFAIAEEVTIDGVHTKRPDIVLYVNGIALGVLELKRSTVSVAEGIRQNLDSQKKEFIQPFYSTVQFVMAGNDTEGLRYSVIETPEKYYLAWKEDSHIENPLDRALEQVCRKDRMLELIHDYMVFDAGIKKTCRHHQYFGVHVAQERIREREGGIIWHTQGSGKSLVMVWLAKWIREHVENSRVLIITDRTELDEQIEKVFKGVNEDIYRTKSGADLVHVLNRSDEWLMCSLVHKFGRSEEADFDAFIEDIKKQLPRDFHAKGDLFVFVDECHRTQSGKLHQAMKETVPGAMLIGFTGTPLLKEDKQKSIEIFGTFIHTYKYDEAVEDEVVLDLRYEARDIDQSITAQDKIDLWFEAKTKGLSDWAKAQLKKRWGTMQKVLSAEDRLSKIVADIMLDMELRDRLKSGHGNALLVCGSIYQACRTYEMLQKHGMAGKCAIVTSYRPAVGDIKGEDAGEGLAEKIQQYEIYRKMLAAHFDEPEDTAMNKVEQFEQDVKKRFINDPGQMKLLIVVDKLLTGFDAPPATYLYIDKQMQDHGLFQAICRVNRLDSPDKEYGYIIDYRDLFKSLERAIDDYTGEAFDKFDREDVEGLLKNRLDKAREKLEEYRESIKALCEPVESPGDTAAYLRFFCTSDTADVNVLKGNEPKRVLLYKLVGAYVRAYANLANEVEAAGYSSSESTEIKADVEHCEKVREEVKLASGDYVDMKMFEPAMRHLLDNYIKAEESEKISAFDDMTLVDMIVARGADALDKLPENIRKNQIAMAETIENNVRKLILDEMIVNPKYFEKMSELLDALIQERKKEALDYKAYLAKIVELTKKVRKPESQTSYPANINRPALRALYDNLEHDEELAIKVDEAIRYAKHEGWKEAKIKQKVVRNAIKSALGGDNGLVDEIFDLAMAQRDY